MPEQYQPSNEEFKNAQEMMTSLQTEMSDDREAQVKALKEMGVEGHLVYEKSRQQAKPGDETDDFDQTITGELNGHNIVLQSTTETLQHNMDTRYKAQVDDVILEPSRAGELWTTYKDVAKLQRQSDIEDAAASVAIEGKKAQLREQRATAKAQRDLEKQQLEELIADVMPRQK